MKYKHKRRRRRRSKVLPQIDPHITYGMGPSLIEEILEFIIKWVIIIGAIWLLFYLFNLIL